jgi:hypothetical protein
MTGSRKIKMIKTQEPIIEVFFSPAKKKWIALSDTVWADSSTPERAKAKLAIKLNKLAERAARPAVCPQLESLREAVGKLVARQKNDRR